MATLDYEEKNQNEKSENSDSISRCQFENASLLNDAWQLSLEKIHDWHESFASYVYFKEKIIGRLSKTDKKNNFYWLETNDLYLENVKRAVDSDKDYWISAAEVSEKIKDKDGKPVLREKWVTSMPCHFLILDLNEAVEAENLNLDFNLSGEQMSELVLEHCRQRGLPEPIIWGDHEELALVWALEKPYEKGEAENLFRNGKGEVVFNEFAFNLAWNDVQNLLCEDFKYLGANPKKKHALTLLRVPGTFNTHADAPVRVLYDAEKTTPEKIKSGLAYVREKIKNQEKIERPNLENKLKNFQKDNEEFLKFCDETDGTDAKIKKSASKPKIKKSNSADSKLKKKQEKAERQAEFREFAERQKKFLDQVYQDVLEIHPASDKYVCLSFKSEKESWGQTFVKAKDLWQELLRLWSEPDFYDKNIYVSQAEFLSDRSRKEDNVASLSLSFLDIDGKFATEQKDLTPEEWANLILEECRSKEIPLPGVIVFSGNGLHVKWLYKEAVTREKLPRWTRLQRRLWKIFESFGADSQAKDAARVLRVPGTKNCKPETIDRDVRVVYSNSERYDFEEFAEIIFKIPGYGDVGEDSEIEKIEKSAPKSKLKSENSPSVNFRASSSSIAEINGAELNAIQRIYCNYAVLSAEKVSDANLKEKSEKIKARCAEYWSGFGFQIPNAIIALNGKLIAVWKYSDCLPGKALSRWQRTQEIINYHFADWGARDNSEYQEFSAFMPVDEFLNEKAEILKFNAKYKFDDLANRVLRFSQPEVRKYKKKKAAEKAKAKAERDIKNLASFKIAPKKRTGSFARQAARRYADIVKLMERRADSRGEVPQGHRELSVFWALVCAAQAGLISGCKEFDALMVELINKNGTQFKIETYAALFGTLRNKFTRHEELYKAKTETIIEALGITVSEQAELEVLRYFPKKEKKPKKIPLRILKPWKDEGKSERTWYRHKQKAREALALESAKMEESENENLTALSVKMRIMILKVFLKNFAANFATKTPIDTEFILSGRKFPYIMWGIDEREYYYSYSEFMENDSSEILGEVLESFIRNQRGWLENFDRLMTQGVGLEVNEKFSSTWFVFFEKEAAGSRRYGFYKTRPPFFVFLARPPPRFLGRWQCGKLDLKGGCC